MSSSLRCKGETSLSAALGAAAWSGADPTTLGASEPPAGGNAQAPASPSSTAAEVAKAVALPPSAAKLGPETLPLTKQWLYAVGQLGWSSIANLIGLQLVYFYLPPADEETGKPIFPIYVTQAPILVVMNVITMIATFGRLWDAITDPLIAGFSDGLKHPRGRRVPFLAAGGLPSAVFCVLLFVPIVRAESAWNIVWLTLMQALFYFFLTLYVTPYFSLVSELGHSPQERLDLSTWISITYALGAVLASGTTAIGGLFSSDEEGSLYTGIVIICFIATICMYVPVFAIDEKVYCMSEPSQIGIYTALRHCVRNRHFRPYVAAEFSYFFATAVITTGMPYYLTVLVRLGSQWLLVIVGTIAVVSFLFYYPTNRLAKTFGKKRLVILALVLLLVVFTLIFFLGWMPLPLFLQIFAVGLLAAVPLAILGVLPNSILSDIAVHDSRCTGRNQQGMYFAARALLTKLGQSCGIMVFAGLTNFGKDVGNDMGVRLSGLVGLGFILMALSVFVFYREDEVLGDVNVSENKSGEPVLGTFSLALPDTLGVPSLKEVAPVSGSRMRTEDTEDTEVVAWEPTCNVAQADALNQGCAGPWLGCWMPCSGFGWSDYCSN